MSAKHPIIAITGSSGAGTTSVTRTFENIFRRENVTAAVIEGDSFHRYDRLEMRKRQAEAEKAGDKHFSHCTIVPLRKHGIIFLRLSSKVSIPEH